MALLSGYYQKNAHFTIEHHAFYVIASCSLMLPFILDFSYCFGRKWHKISSSSYLQLTLPPRYPQPKPTSLYTKVVIEKKRSTYQLTIFRDYFLYLRRWWFAVILHQCIFDFFSETSNKIHELPACIELPPLPFGFILFLSFFFYLVLWYFLILS